MHRQLVFFIILITMPGCAGNRPAAERAVPERVFAYDCGAVDAVLGTAQDDTAWLFIAAASVPLTQVIAASGVRYVGQGYTFWTKGDGALLETPEQTSVVCRLDRLATPWQAARLRGVEFRAVGNEPGWVMEITADEIALELDYGSRQLLFIRPALTRQAAEDVEIYRVEDGGHKLEVQITWRPCQDTMADQDYAAGVSVTLDGRQYTGCGRKLTPPAP